MPQISKAIGLNQSQVCKLLNESEAKKQLEDHQLSLVSWSPLIQDKFFSLCFHPDPKISSGNINSWYKMTGMFPSNAPSYIFQSILNVQNNVAMPTIVLDVLSQVLPNQQPAATTTIDIGTHEMDDSEE